MAEKPASSARGSATRAKLVNAFVSLALSRGFDKVSMDDVAAAAGVSRSTAYTHFRGTVPLLNATLSRPCTALAASVRLKPVPELVFLLQHFQEQWHRNPMFFREPIRSLFSQCLARTIATALRLDPDRNRHRPAMPRGMLPAVLAELQLGIVERWLEGETTTHPEVIAAALTASAHRLVFGERT